MTKASMKAGCFENRYSQGGGEGEPAPDIEEKARPLFFQCLDEIRKLLPRAQAVQVPKWRGLSRIDLEDLYAFVYGFLAEEDEGRDEYLQAELRVTSAFLLVKHLDDCRVHADEMIFYQRVRKQLSKVTPGSKLKRDLEVAVRDLVDDAVESESVVDIFKSAGIEKADISILDDQFLQTFKDRKHENLRLKLLEKLLFDEIQRRQKQNIAKAKSFREMLEKTLQRYHGRLIDAAAVVQEMIKMRQEMEAADARAKRLNLGEDELAFYDAVSDNYETVYEQPFLRDLVHEVVQTIKSNLKVDWIEPHRDDVRAAIRTAVKRVLRRRDVKAEDFEPFMEKFMAQAEALYAEWPLAA
jgi:type I restriction enzyme R subunit